MHIKSIRQHDPERAVDTASAITGRKALLLRVGIDRGTGGALGPVFADGTFEYVPIPEAGLSRCSVTYATLAGRHTASLAALLPPRLARRHPHIDPDFETATYGDAAPRKRQQLLRLGPGDLLVFYAGLEPSPAEDRARLFAIGSLAVKKVYELSSRDIGRASLRRRFGRTAHFLRRPHDRNLVLVEGQRSASKLFERAIPLGDGRNCLLQDLASFAYEGSLLRAVGHWIQGPAAIRSLEAWLRHGPASLVRHDTRLLPASSRFHRIGRSGDLIIKDQRARVGDWIAIIPECATSRIQVLARVNRIAFRRGRRSALSSLFWYFDDGGPVLSGPMMRSLSRDAIISVTRLIRQVLSWFHARYRIGQQFGRNGREAFSS